MAFKTKEERNVSVLNAVHKFRNLDKLTDEELSAVDPVQLAEDMEVKNEDLLCLSVVMEVNRAKKERLRSKGDSCYGTTVTEYEAILTDLGFEKKGEFFFDGAESDGSTGKEKGYIYQDKRAVWQHPDGIIVSFETYCERSINRADLAFHAIAATDKLFRGLNLSGGPVQMKDGTSAWDKNHELLPFAPDSFVIHGSIHVLEGLRSSYNKLRAASSGFLPWEDKPGMFCLRDWQLWKEKEKARIEAVEDERYAALPEETRALINGHYTYRRD